MSTEKQTARYGPFQNIFAQAVRKGDTIHLAGQVSIDAEGKPLAAGDLVEQTRHVYANIREALSKFGASMSDITDEAVYVTDVGALLGNLEAWCGVRSEAYGHATPEVAQTCVQVAALLMPELQIEIKCTAQL